MIFAPKRSEIVLEFESFELEPDPTPPTGVFCRYDRLEIWDGFPGGEQNSSYNRSRQSCAFLVFHVTERLEKSRLIILSDDN